MIFKRQEGVRYAIGQPLDIEQTQIPCEILDISPRGLKIMSGEDFNEHKNKILQLEITFILDSTEIKGIGEIVWSKKIGSGYHYGITFFNQSSVEDLIINELKARRRKEILQAKIKS